MAKYTIRFNRNVNYPDMSSNIDANEDTIFNEESLNRAIDYVRDNNVGALFETGKDFTNFLKDLKKRCRYEIEFDCTGGLNENQHGSVTRRITKCPSDNKAIIIGNLVASCPDDVECDGQQFSPGGPTSQIGCINAKDRDIFAGAKQPPSTPQPRNGKISNDPCVPHGAWWKPFPAGEGPSPPIKFRLVEKESIKYNIGYLLRMVINLKITCKTTEESLYFDVPAFYNDNPTTDCIFNLSQPGDDYTKVNVIFEHIVKDTQDRTESTLTRRFARSGRTTGGSLTNFFAFVPNPDSTTPRELIDSIPNANNWLSDSAEPLYTKYIWSVYDFENNIINTNDNPIITNNNTQTDETNALNDAQNKYPIANSVGNPRPFLDRISGSKPRPSTLIQKLNNLVKKSLSSRIVQLENTLLDELVKGTAGNFIYKDYTEDIDAVIELLDKCDTTIEIQGFSLFDPPNKEITLKDDHPDGIFLYNSLIYHTIEDDLRISDEEDIYKLFR